MPFSFPQQFEDIKDEARIVIDALSGHIPDLKSGCRAAWAVIGYAAEQSLPIAPTPVKVSDVTPFTKQDCIDCLNDACTGKKQGLLDLPWAKILPIVDVLLHELMAKLLAV